MYTSRPPTIKLLQLCRRYTRVFRALQTRSIKSKQQRPFWSAAAFGERPSSSTLESSQDSRSAQSSHSQPVRKCLVVVEGPNDRLAVHRALHAEVFILGGAAWLEAARSASALSALQRRLDSFDAVYTLLDPDVAGRQGRNKLEEAFPGQLWHAFIPARLATARQATRHHEAGNIGVEHANAENIRLALQYARLAQPGRQAFSRAKLFQWQLVADHNAPQAGAAIARRRELVCNMLGLGICDGKQLLKQLNLYGFERSEVEQVLRAANESLAREQQFASTEKQPNH